MRAPGHGAACGPCPAGYTGNGEKCLGTKFGHKFYYFIFPITDIDECASNLTNNCGQICINSFGSFMCSCERGFRLVRETGECQGDVDHIKFNTLPPLLFM